MFKLTLTLLFFLASMAVNAQTASKIKPLDASSVVRGEDGYVYPYEKWRSLMATGKFGLKSRNTFTDAGEPEYLIYELSDEERENYFRKLPKPKASDAFPEGEPFKPVKMTDLSGNKFDLEQLKGKILVLNFWFIDCPPCRKEIPQLNILADQYKDQPKVVFLAVANDDRYNLENFLKQIPFNYHQISGERKLNQKYGVNQYPTHVVIDDKGKIHFSTVGLAAQTYYWLHKSIEECLKLAQP